MLWTITIELMCAIFEKMGCKDLEWKRTSCVARGADGVRDPAPLEMIAVLRRGYAAGPGALHAGERVA